MLFEQPLAHYAWVINKHLDFNQPNAQMQKRFIKWWLFQYLKVVNSEFSEKQLWINIFAIFITIHTSLHDLIFLISSILGISLSYEILCLTSERITKPEQFSNIISILERQ